MARRKTIEKEKAAINFEEPIPPNPFAELLIKQRAVRKLTQQDLAEMAGVHSSTVSHWERGDAIPGNTETITRIAKALDVDPKELMEMVEFVRTSEKGIIESIQEDIELEEKKGSREKEPARQKREIPQVQESIVRGDTEIIVAMVDRVWCLPVDALVIPIYLDGSNYQYYNVGFWQKLEKNVPGRAYQELYEIVSEYFQTQREMLFSYSLPGELAREILPFAAPGQARILLSTYTEDVSYSREKYVEDTLKGIIADSRAGNIQRIALPVIGAPPRTKEQTSVPAFRLLLDNLLAVTDFGALKTIYIPADYEDEFDAARRQLNRFKNNRAQPLISDLPAAEDLLGISQEVDALTETLLLKEVKPPISVGIIGGWGSGKSSVMQLMHRKMAQIRLQKVDPERIRDTGASKVSDHVGHIYQIHFNAWTYAKSNLWASLMQEIFCTLNRQLSIEQRISKEYPPEEGGVRYLEIYSGNTVDSYPLWDTLRDRKKPQIEKLQKVEQEIADLKVKRDSRLAELRNEILKELTEKGFKAAADVLKKRVNEQFSDNLTKDAKNIIENNEKLDEEQVEEFFKELHSLNSLAIKVWSESSGNRKKQALSLFAVLIIPLVITIMSVTGADTASRIITGILSCIPVSTAILRTMLLWNKQTNTLESAHRSTVEIEQSNQLSQKDELMNQKTNKFEQDLMKSPAGKTLDEDEADSELKQLAADGNIAAYDRRLEYLEVKKKELLEKAGPAASFSSLLDFVKARQNEAVYKESLGLMHKVKTDIDELSEGLRILNSDSIDPNVIAEKQLLFPRGEARIILYIDDLDRCPPSRVVEVLEAVQLLSETKLFVVVLGLDTRYITRALEKEYAGILQHEGTPSGLDYIEKIIQIPYRVRPISPEGLSTFLESQMEISEVSRDLLPPAEIDNHTKDDSGDITGDEEDNPDLQPEQIGKPEVIPSLEDLPSEIIKFTRDDFTDLNICCRRISLTPRSVKRLVNVLKLVQIFWFRTLGQDRPRKVKQAVIALLALSAGYPAIMREVFVQLETRYHEPEKSRKLKLATFMENFRLAAGLESAYAWQYDQFRTNVTALFSLTPEPGQRPVNYLRATLKEFDLKTFDLVRSFSFVGDPTYEIEENELNTEEQQKQK